jgi:hypothetical protein
MADAEGPRRRPQSFPARLRLDERPALARDALAFGGRRVAAGPSAASSAQQAFGTQQRDERQSDHVYLEQAILTASATIEKSSNSRRPNCSADAL